MAFTRWHKQQTAALRLLGHPNISAFHLHPVSPSSRRLGPQEGMHASEATDAFSAAGALRPVASLGTPGDGAWEEALTSMKTHGAALPSAMGAGLLLILYCTHHGAITRNTQQRENTAFERLIFLFFLFLGRVGRLRSSWGAGKAHKSEEPVGPQSGHAQPNSKRGDQRRPGGRRRRPQRGQLAAGA